MSTPAEIDLVSYVDEARADAEHAYAFLRDTGTLTASRIFGITHRIPGRDQVLQLRFPPPWSRERGPSLALSGFAERSDLVLHEERLAADTVIHVHTPHLSAWSLAQIEFPILYVAAQRHLLARRLPNHLDRTRSVREVVRERLDRHPELAPPPGILESNGGANIWGQGIVATARLILLIEEAARLQSIAAGIGGARDYTPGALERQWQRTGLLEASRAYQG